MTENQKAALGYLETIGSTEEFRPVDFFLMVQDTGLTIQECSNALFELEELRKIDAMDKGKLALFMLR